MRVACGAGLIDALCESVSTELKASIIDEAAKAATKAAALLAAHAEPVLRHLLGPATPTSSPAKIAPSEDDDVELGLPTRMQQLKKAIGHIDDVIGDARPRARPCPVAHLSPSLPVHLRRRPARAGELANGSDKLLETLVQGVLLRRASSAAEGDAHARRPLRRVAKALEAYETRLSERLTALSKKTEEKAAATVGTGKARDPVRRHGSHPALLALRRRRRHSRDTRSPARFAAG